LAAEIDATSHQMKFYRRVHQHTVTTRCTQLRIHTPDRIDEYHREFL